MLENKNIIITGAGSGIGRATSILAAGYGANVVCVDLNPCVEETVQEIKAGNGNAVAQIADVSREDDVQHYIQICIDTFGSLHGIYANAGVSGGGKPMLDLTVEDWHRTLSVNTLGVFLAVKHSVPHFTQAGAGAIVCQKRPIWRREDADPGRTGPGPFGPKATTNRGSAPKGPWIDI